MAHDIQRRARRQRVGTQFCVKGPAGQVANCPSKFWSAGEPDLGLPGLVRGQLGSLASWAEHGPVQWWRGWETKTGRRAKRAKLGRYVATEIKKETDSYGSVSAGREKWPFNVLFFLKVEPPCDQTWWDSLVFSILSCFSYVVDAENTLVGPVGPF